MADKIEIPVEIRPHRFEEVKQQLNTILDPKTLSADAQILLQNVMGSLDVAQAEMTSQMAENKFNIPKLNLKTIDKQLGALIKKVQEDLGKALPQSFIDAQKELEKLNSAMGDNQRKQKDLIQSIKDTPSVAEQTKTVAPAGFKKFGIAGDETATLNRVLELEKKISETKDKRKLGPLQAELEYQNKVLEVQRSNNKELTKKQGLLTMLQSEESKLAAFADVQRDKQVEAMKASKDTSPTVLGLLKVREQNTKGIAAGISFQQQYNSVKAKSAAAEKKESAAIKGTTNSIAEKSVKVLGMNLIYQQLKKILFDSIRTIRELDKALTDAAIVTSMSRKQTWELIGSYQELAKRTGMATSEIASIVTEFLRQGRSLQDSMKLAEVAAKSAKVAGISARDAVNYLTSAVNGFGLSADQAEDIADKFAAVAARSATNFEELAVAMSKVSPTAKSAGVSVDFMMGVIAKGIETTREAPENIGTAFKTIFARMREVTDLGKSMEDGMNLNRVEKALLSVNVPLRDITGQFRNLEDVLLDVGNKWTTLTSVEQAYLATALAGSRQQPRLLAIFNDFARTKELIQISAEATGGLSLQHMEYMMGMEAALARLKTAWEGFITSIVSADIVVGFFGILQGGIEALTDVIQAIGPSTTIMIGLVTALGVSYAFTNNRLSLFIKGLQASAESSKALTIAQKGMLAVGNLLNAQKVVQSVLSKRSNADAQTSLALTLKGMGLKLSEAKIQAFITAVRSKDNKVRQKGTLIMMKDIFFETLGIGVKTASASATTAGAVANVFYGKSLIVLTGGLILILPLLLGLIAGMISFVKSMSEGKKSTSGFAALFGSLGEIFKSIFEVIKSVVMVIFDLGKFIAMLNLAIIGLILKLVTLTPNFQFLVLGMKALNIVFKAINIGMKLFSNLIQGLVEGFLDLVSAIEDIPLIGDVIKAIVSFFNYLGSALDNANKALDAINTSLTEFGRKANEGTVKLSEFNKNVNNVKNLKKEFDELNKQANKTPEEMERINEILNELKNIEIDGKSFNFTTDFNGVLSLNTQLLDETLVTFNTQQQQAKTDLNKIIDDAIFAYGKAGEGLGASVNRDVRGAFEEAGVIEAAKFLGQEYARTFVKGLSESGSIEDTMAMELLRGVNTSILSADKSFFNSFVANGKFAEGEMNTFIGTLITTTQTQVMSLNSNLKTIVDSNKTDLQKARETLQAQADSYKAALIAARNTFKDTAELTFATKFLAESMQDEAILYDLINKRSINIEAILSLKSSGMSLTGMQDFLVETFQDLTSKLDSSGQGFAYSVLKPQFEAAVASAFSQTGQGVEQGIKAYGNLLRTAGFTGDEFKEKFIEFSNAVITKSGEATATLLEDQRKTNEKLFALPEKIKKGDFKDYAELAAEFGADTVKKLLSGSETGVTAVLEKQTKQTLDGIQASIEKITTTAEVLGRPLSKLEEQEVSMLQTMFSYYQDIVAVEQLRTYQIKESTDLLKESSDLIKLQENLVKFGIEGETPLMNTLDDLIGKTQELAESKALKTYEADLQRLSKYGSFGADGIFSFFSADTVDATAAKIALDNYTDSLSNLVNAQMQAYEIEKKAIEDRYKTELDAIKTSNDEKWKAIEYSDKLMETEEKIASSRRSLLGLSISGASSGMVNQAQKDLEKMQKERQKMIEQQMIDQAQKELEASRDLAMQELGQQQLTAMGNLTEAIVSLTGAVEDNSEVTSTPASTGGSGTIQNTTIKTFTSVDTLGTY